MGGIGGSALVLSFLLLPGLAGALVIARGDGFASDRSYLSASFARRVVAFSICVMAAHTVLIWLIANYHQNSFLLKQIDFELVFNLIYPNGRHLEELEAGIRIGQDVPYIFGYQVAALTVSGLAGYVLSKVPLRAQSWFETVARDELKKHKRKATGFEVFLLVTATVDYGKDVQLISGIHRYVVSEDGNDIALLLLRAKRRPYAASEEEWVKIPGELFAIKFERISTLNLNLFWVEKEDS